MHRLEAATSRIEDIAASQGLSVAGTAKSAIEPSPPPPPPPPPVPAPAEVPKSVVVFDEIVINGKLKSFVELTRSFAGPNVVEIVRNTFHNMPLRLNCVKGVYP